jgi:hypothetical protein
VVVKCIRRQIFFGSEQRKVTSRNKSQQSATPAAHRTIAIDCLGELTFDLKRDIAAMTASFIAHGLLLKLHRVSAATPAGNVSMLNHSV